MEKTIAQIRAENGKLGGRPKGSKNKLTILRERKRDSIDKSVALMSQKLVNAQAIVALGTHKMVRMYKGSDDKMHVETIRDMTRMQNLLDTGVYGLDYIIVVGEMPEWKAAQSLLDRTFGKAKESIQFSGDIEFSLKGLAAQRKDLSDDIIDIDSMEHEPSTVVDEPLKIIDAPSKKK